MRPGVHFGILISNNMSKLSPKDWLRLFALYGFLTAILILLYFFFGSLKSFFLSIPGLREFIRNHIQSSVEWLSAFLPQNIQLYFWALVILGVLYFLLEDLVKLFRGKKDEIHTNELALEDQVLQDLAREYHQEMPRTLGETQIQLRYIPIIHYWIAGLLLFGLCAAWGMAIAYPKEMTGLFPITITLSGLSFYILFQARSATRKIFLDSKHLWMGKKESKLFPENHYVSVYYTHFLVRRFMSVEKHFNLLVFRRGFSFPPLHWFIDRFFPASNSNRQVIFLNIWKDENGEHIQANSLAKRILEEAERNKVKIKHWTSEAQFFLIFAIFGLFLAGWIYFKKHSIF